MILRKLRFDPLEVRFTSDSLLLGIFSIRMSNIVRISELYFHAKKPSECFLLQIMLFWLGDSLVNGSAASQSGNGTSL